MYVLDISQPGSYSKEIPIALPGSEFLVCFKHVARRNNPMLIRCLCQLLDPSQHTNTGHKVN